MASAIDIARTAAQAGADAIRSRGRNLGAIETKGSPIDLVTETDVASGVAAVRAIRALSPSARFLVEEEPVYERAGVEPGSLTDTEVWVIDPLDGTTSYVHDYPCYSVSVALLREGAPVAGAVFDVPAAELFAAAAGEGAFLGDRRIHAGSAASLAEALLITGFPYDRGALLDRQLAVLARFLRAPVHGIRRDGSAAVDCTRVACGRADGYWEFGLKPWDTAAGVVILREAGAHVSGIDGEPWSTESTGIIAADRQLHDAMAEVIHDIREDAECRS